MASNRHIAQAYHAWITASGPWDAALYDRFLEGDSTTHPAYPRFKAWRASLRGTPHERPETASDFQSYVRSVVCDQGRIPDPWDDNEFLHEYIEACGAEERVPTPAGLAAYVRYKEIDWDLDAENISAFNEAMEKDD
jgi:hypothetical protein